MGSLSGWSCPRLEDFLQPCYSPTGDGKWGIMRFSRYLCVALCLLPLLSKASEVNYSDLVTLIKDKNILSIDQLLPNLPLAYRSNYNLVYASRSLQPASAQFPRVIIFGHDARLMMAFSGNPKGPKADSLELIEFQLQTAKFVFREIRFPTKPDEKVVFDEAPTTCILCHKKDSRPNWDPFHFWPGVYGSISRRGITTIEKGAQEDKFYQSFLNENARHGRYASLPSLPIKDMGSLYAISDGVNTDPTGRMTALLQDLNRQRIKRLMSELIAKKPKFLPSLVMAYHCSQTELEEAFPPELQTNMRKLELVLSDINQTFKKDFDLRVARIKDFNGSGGDPERTFFNLALDPDVDELLHQDHAIAPLQYVFDRMGANVDDWAMAFNGGKMQLFEPFSCHGNYINTGRLL